MRFLIATTMQFMLSGCVGLAVGTFDTFEGKTEDFTLSEKRNKFAYGNAAEYTQEQVITLWGQPDEKHQEGLCSVFSYYDGYNWRGVGAFVLLVPVPLLVPSGHSEIKIYFKDNKSTAVVTEYGEVSSMFGFMCGSNECGFTAGAVNQNRTRNIKPVWCE